MSENDDRALTEEEWRGIDIGEYDTFIMRIRTGRITLARKPPQAPTKSVDLVTEFKKGIKRDASIYPVLMDYRQGRPKLIPKIEETPQGLNKGEACEGSLPNYNSTWYAQDKQTKKDDQEDYLDYSRNYSSKSNIVLRHSILRPAIVEETITTVDEPPLLAESTTELVDDDPGNNITLASIADEKGEQKRNSHDKLIVVHDEVCKQTMRAHEDCARIRNQYLDILSKTASLLESETSDPVVNGSENKVEIVAANAVTETNFIVAPSTDDFGTIIEQPAVKVLITTLADDDPTFISGVTKCNIRSDDSVPIRRLSQSYVSNNTFQGIVEVFTQIR